MKVKDLALNSLVEII